MSPDKSSAKKTYHHGNLRAALLEAADELLSERGVDAVTTRACARAANVAPSSVFRHFKDRRALLTELACRYLHELHDALSQHASGSTAQAKVYLSRALQRPSQLQLIFNPELVDNRDAKYLAAQDAISQVMTAKVPNTELEGDIDLLMRSAIHGLSMLAAGGFLQDSLPADQGVREEVLERCIGRAAAQTSAASRAPAAPARPSPKDLAAPALTALDTALSVLPPRTGHGPAEAPFGTASTKPMSDGPLRRLAERAREHENMIKPGRFG